MKYTAGALKESLLSMIREMGEHPERYAKNPGKDFTRRRSLTLPTLISLILTMDEKSVWKGLFGYFQNGIDTPSASAFVQQRKKLLPCAFEELFHRFTDSLTARKNFRGYRLLAVDGTSLKSTSYPEDSDAYRPGTQRQHGWNLYHLNALFDLENGIYTDVLVQKEHTKSEDAALCEMADRSTVSEPVILLADRGYEAYNNFAHLEQAGWKYLIRLKDRNRTYAYGVTLPDQPEFDLPVHVTLGRLTRRQLEQRSIPIPEAYCRIPNNVPFDYLQPGSTDFYLFSARIVRLRLKDGSTETLITNLDQTQFPPAALRDLYARRWGIETSFRQLKYTVGMVHLHSKRPELILQEIFSAFIIFNFTQATAWDVDTEWGSSKYKRRVNFSDAVYLCCQALRGRFLNLPPFLERKLLPFRPDRRYPRPIIAGNRISPMYVPSR